MQDQAINAVFMQGTSWPTHSSPTIVYCRAEEYLSQRRCSPSIDQHVESGPVSVHCRVKGAINIDCYALAQSMQHEAFHAALQG